MAEVVLVAACSHSPFLYAPHEGWTEARSRRTLRADVPEDTPEENRAKWERCQAGFATLREQLRAARPDVLLVVGDDQGEQFDFNNFPGFAMCVAPQFDVLDRRVWASRFFPEHQPPEAEVRKPIARGHPELGMELLPQLVRRGFDLAMCLDLPHKERGLGHAFANPSWYVDPEYELPILPLFVNCYYPPQPIGRRCYELGRAIRDVLGRLPLGLRVAVLASGGLWHTPGMPEPYLDEKFDQSVLDLISSGRSSDLADFFDAYPWRGPDSVRPGAERVVGYTGMRGGVGSGSGETRNWIVAAGVAEGAKATVIEYVPVYASPCGMGFAYWSEP